jgi:uncharacterized membrane protein YkvA (DUF1232 family)
MENVRPTFSARMRALKRKCVVLQLAMGHGCTPWYAKACGALTLLYALSPIDLIPDFIPVLGQLDDLLIVPIGIWLTLNLIPADVWRECEVEAARRELGKPEKDWRGIILIVFIWLVLLGIGLLVVRNILS